tara:strand:- start:157 stop:375 length:219 start_codon:yes stop_codon:yes gene_type:complete
MKKVLNILTFTLLAVGVLLSRGNDFSSNKSGISIKSNPYYFDVGVDDDVLYKKRSYKRRKIKRKPRRGRDNR